MTENQRQRIVQMEAAGHHIILFGKDVSWPVEAEDYFTADEIRDITAELRTYLAIEKALADEAVLNGGSIANPRTTAAVAERTGDNIRTIQRYKHLNNLIPDFLSMLDSGDISLRTAGDLSDLPPEEQQMVKNELEHTEIPITSAQAQALKNLSKAKLLNEERCKHALTWRHGSLPTAKSVEKAKSPRDKAPRPRMIKLPWENLEQFFSSGTSPQEIEQTIYDALLEYRKERKQA